MESCAPVKDPFNKQLHGMEGHQKLTTTVIPLAVNPPHCTCGGNTIEPDHVKLFIFKLLVDEWIVPMANVLVTT